MTPDRRLHYCIAGARCRAALFALCAASFAMPVYAQDDAAVCLNETGLAHDDCLTDADPVAACSMVLDNDPADIEARASLCDALVSVGDFDRASASLSEARSVHGDDEEHLAALQQMLANVENASATASVDGAGPAETVADAEPVTDPEGEGEVVSSPSDVALWSKCLALEERRGDLETAKSVCEQAVESARDQYELALMTRTLKKLQRREAREQLAQCETAASAPDADLAAEVCLAIETEHLSATDSRSLERILATLDVGTPVDPECVEEDLDGDGEPDCTVPIAADDASTDVAEPGTADEPGDESAIETTDELIAGEPVGDETGPDALEEPPQPEVDAEAQLAALRSRCLDYTPDTLADAQAACQQMLVRAGDDAEVQATLRTVDALVNGPWNEPLEFSAGVEAITY